MTYFNAIGLMSGTSMDGIDCAIIKTDGKKNVQSLASLSYKYDAKTRQILKRAEKIARQSQGQEIEAEAEKLSTQLHIDLVKALLIEFKFKLKLSDIDVIGYHGQTLYHNPAQKVTLQIGAGQRMADACQINVVNNFRCQDVLHGGQGAPLAPLYHQALAKQDKIDKVALINCGGIANITLINGDDILGFDTGPGNALLDKFVKLKTNAKEFMDTNGQYGLKGQVDAELLELLEDCCVLNGKNYFMLTPPKSLDIADFNLPEKLFELSLADGCKTLAAFTAKTIVDSLDLFTAAAPKLFLLAGGGWNNPVIKAEFELQLNRKLKNVTIKTSNEIAWPNQYLEAEVFAFLAVRHLLQLPLSLPQTTGVSEPMLGGLLHKYKRNKNV